jgi:hypothetical protein
VTKVLLAARGLGFGALLGAASLALAQNAEHNLPDRPAEKLYLQLGEVGLDPERVYQVRGASLDRSSVHISLDDGTIGFTKDVMGRATGAFFEGDGEILLAPPNEVERRSMSLFTGMAILEEHFSTAYFRFNDNSAQELAPGLRAAEDKQEFLDRWSGTARNLAELDAMRMLLTFSRWLPVHGHPSSENQAEDAKDHFLHARLQGVTHGVFDVYFDSQAAEQVQVGQAKTGGNGTTYYDVWTSFSQNTARPNQNISAALDDEKPQTDPIAIRRYVITAEIEPPKRIEARARLAVEIRQSGLRIILLELSRFLEVETVKINGQPAEFIHNPAVEGTQLARRGNDFLAVILPEPALSGQKMELEFDYSGEVLAEAGSGLLYVGARGTWYPNRGLQAADFDLEFSYPPGWMLVATGKPIPATAADAAKARGLETSHWISERPIPVAGFNLGKYKVAKTRAGNVMVETYATQAVEKDFPRPPIETIEPFSPGKAPSVPPRVLVPQRPSPSKTEVTVAEAAAEAIEFYAERFGPFPYSHLALTQMPGSDSQGWPGLVFLSSYAFLTDDEREQLHFEPARILLQHSIPAHETAHQWWGDLVVWEGYRDQWLSEGLANYCALMILQEKNPAGFRQVMDKYRRDLVQENKEGMSPKDAGPVTLGYRLLSSKFPEGYEAISYGRSTWLFHMLRTMLKDAAVEQGSKAMNGPDEPFVRVLRKIRQQYEGKAIDTRELIDAFAENLPPALRYEGKSSLDWFLEGWVNGTSLPRLELTAVRFTARGRESRVSGTILQKNAPEDLVTSVPVYAVITGKPPVLLGRVFADGEESSFHLAAPAGTRKILLDPYETILTSPGR